jgi:cellulose synthase/poly-beta-1,6-N-acetylglucosamine synthase-like glycosyltransferase
VISDTTPRGSIVTIFLNAERFLDQAMQNVPRQNFTDFARIVLDDGSTDGSTAMLKAPSRQTWLDGPDYLVKTPPDAECLL